MNLMPSPSLRQGSQLHGFVVLRVELIQDLCMVFYEFEHINSGAKFIYMHRDHRNNGFCITFLTPPQDDTGLPHIIEHSVLDGSRKYPALGSYFELAKGSATDYTQATTSQVSTYFEACSYIPADIFNFADFYIDSALNPLLSEQTFSGEAWHYIAKEDATSSPSLGIEGIVFNEMKLSESSIDKILERSTIENILPNSPYQWNAGGTTGSIPRLNYQQFLDFHKKWYTTENSLLMAYGNINPEAWLNFLDERLPSYTPTIIKEKRECHKEAVLSAFMTQSDWTEPKECTARYAIENDNTAEKTYHRFVWLIPSKLQSDQITALEILSSLVINKIRDRADLYADKYGPLCEEHSGLSYLDDRMLFSVCFQYCEGKHKASLRRIVLKMLSDIVTKGFETDLIENIFHQTKGAQGLGLTESSPSVFFGHIRRSWIKNVDIVKHLNLMMSPQQVDELHGQWTKSPTLFTELMKNTLIDNMHRLDLTVTPDPELSNKTNQQLAEQLAAVRESMSEDVYNKIKLSNSFDNSTTQQTLPPSVPHLRRQDLPLKVSYTPYSEEILPSGAVFLQAPLPAGGLNYVTIAIDLDGLDSSLDSFIPIYCYIVTNGWANRGSREPICGEKYSISCNSYFSTNPGVPSKTERKILLSASWMTGETTKMLDAVTECIYCLDTFKGKIKRRDASWLITTLMTQYDSLLSEMQSPNANFLVRDLRSMINESGYLNDLSYGLPLLTVYNEGICEDPEAVLEDLLGLLKQIDCFTKSHRNWIVSVAGSDPSIETVKSRIDSMVNTFGTSHPTSVPLELISYFSPPRIGFSAPLLIGTCAMVIEIPTLTPVEHTVLTLGLKIISQNYLLKELRQTNEHVYSTFCDYKNQTIALLTMADSCIEHTVEVFMGVVDYIKTSNWSEAEIQRFAINTAKDYLPECRPSRAAIFIMYNYLVKCSGSSYQAQYDKLLAITASEVKSVLLKAFSPNFDKAVIGVLANQSELDRLNKAVFKDQLSINVLPI